MHGAVMVFRRSRGFTAAVVAVVAVVWGFASNHCALAALKSPATSEHACCHTDKGTSQSAGRAVQCCKGLAAPVPSMIAAPVAHVQEIEPAWLAAERVESSPKVPTLAVDFASNSDPPQGASSFALLVLKRSLPAHAPPVLFFET
jgi:hypothetical protein